MRPKKQTESTDAIFIAEVDRRDECHTNRELAELTGFTPSYCAKIVSRFRRAKGKGLSILQKITEKAE